MCSFGATAMAIGQIGANYLGQRSQAKAYQQQMNQQAKVAFTQMNYAFQNYEQERTDAFDQAVNEINKARQNSLQLNSGVKAAINENMTGRTANLLVRASEGDTARAVSSIQDNYKRKSNEIDLNKEATLLSTKSYINNLNTSAPKMPSRLTNFISSSATALEAYTMGMNQKNIVKATGQKYNWWTGGAKTNNALSSAKTYVGSVPLTVYKRDKIGTPQWFGG